MPVYKRQDEPGAWHHVMNRGLAHRAIFETGADVRFFTSRLARAVRRNEIELHAFSFLPTHFHLLLRSLRGDISGNMMWIQNQFVRWFNRRRRRDGPLFRGRFCSRRILSSVYWRTVVRYIDNNAVAAKLARASPDYPYGSARFYIRKSGPAWLCRSAIEQEVKSVLGSGSYDPTAYLELFGGDIPSPLGQLVDRRISQRRQDDDPLDHLVQAAPAAIRRWLTRQVRNADGIKDDQILLDPNTILEEIAVKQSGNPVWPVRPGGRRFSGWTVLTAGLLRTMAGLPHSETSLRTESTEASVCRHIREHKLLLLTDRSYRCRAADIVSEVVKRNFHSLMPESSSSLAF